MTFRQGTEEYYKKFLELQEKLRKSEEERLKLEMKFNDMMQVTREEEQMYYRKLRTQYKQFLEENRKRQDRNERILRLLERIESRATMLEAKTQRFQLLRRQYQNFLKRICSQKLQEIKENDTKALPKSIYKSNTHSDMYPNSVYQTERKEDILKKYLDEMESRNSITGNASTIADDIMNSIYSRKHFHKDDEYLPTVPSGSTLKPGIRFENAEPNMHDKIDKTIRKLDLQHPIDKYDSSSEDDLNADKCYRGKEHRLINRTNGSGKDEYNKDKYNQGDSFSNFVEETKCDNVNVLGNAKPGEYGDSKDKNILKNDKFNESFDVFKAGVEKPFEKKVQYTLGNEETLLGTNPETTIDKQQKEEIELEAYEKENSESSEKELKYDKDNTNGLENILPTGLPISKDLVSLGEKNEEEQLCGNEELHEGLDYDKNGKVIDKLESSIDYLENDKNKERINNEENVDFPLDENTTEAPLDNNYPNNTLNNEELTQEILGDGKGLKAEEILLVPEDESKSDVKAVKDEIVIENKDAENNEELNVTSPEEMKPSAEQKSEGLKLKSEEIHIDEVITNSNNAPMKVEEKQDDEVQDYLSKQELKEPTREAEEKLPISGTQEELPISGAQDEIAISGAQEDLSISGAQQEMSMDYDATMQPINYDENEQPILNQHYDANGQPLQYNQQDIQYDQNGQPIQYDEYGQPIQYDENGQQVHYDENGQQVHYDENGQPIHYDEHGQQIHYDENGQQLHFDEHGQQIHFDENGQQIHYDEHGQQIHYDENGQQVQYDENGQQIQYDANGQQIHYDENGQQLLYDANGQQIHYDENGQQITYDENGQAVAYNVENERQLQYDETGQPIQYGDNGQFIQFDSTGRQIHNVENEQQLISNSENNNEESPSNVLSDQEINAGVSEEPVNYEQGDLGKSSNLPDQNSDGRNEVDQSETLESSQAAFPDAKDEKKTNVIDLLETDSESIKQDTKVSNDSDFDFSNN